MLASRLTARGATVRQDGVRLTVDLGPSTTTSDLLRTANEVEVTIVELCPVARVLA
jgi:hypothetical protein